MDVTHGDKTQTQAVPAAGIAVAVLCAIAASWTGAGSLGLMAHPLRRVLMWILLAACVAGGVSTARWTPWRRLSLVSSLVVGVAATAWMEHAVNVMAVPLILCALMATQLDVNRRVVRCAAVATTVFALHRLLLLSVPSYWYLAGGVGRYAALVVGWVTGRPMQVAITFGGVDFLVLMTAWYAAWLVHTVPPRRERAVYGALSIIGAHAAYLVLLAYVPSWIARLPAFNAAASDPLWLSMLRHALPWNITVVAALAQLLVCAAMLHWSAWNPFSSLTFGPLCRIPTWFRPVAVTLVAIVLGLSTTLYRGRDSLADTHIVINKEGFLNWLKPEHEDYGRLSIGMYGLLSHFLNSLGGQCTQTTDFSAADLKDADLLVLIYLDDKLPQDQIDRIRDFVKHGGSLWVLGEHTVTDEAQTGKTDAYNTLLEDTRMQVLFDSATFAVGGWLHSFEMVAHPVTLGVKDDRNQPGIVIGASVQAQWPAYPVVLGRWGWSDWGDLGKGPSYMGNGHYNAGERLGDLVLAAEQRYGRGRIVVFGDTSSLSNGINMGAHAFTSRMFNYLANRLAGPSPWRGLLAWVAGLTLLAFVFSWPTFPNLSVLTITLILTRVFCTVSTHRAMAVIPHGGRMSDYELAYIDTSHNGRFSHESWRWEGMMGLSLNLMRNGYLTLTMPEFNGKALTQADLFVCCGPMRRYSRSERRDLKAFVEKGGILIVTVSYPDRWAAMPLLDDFGFNFGEQAREPPTTLTEPIPCGYFKSPYFGTDEYMTFVRFDASWPVDCRYEDHQVIANGVSGGSEEPVMICRRVGKGKVLFVGDTGFPMNKNLEVESGEPFEGMRENPHFWRWLVTYLRDEPIWTPPNPNPPPAAEPEVTPAADGAAPAEEEGAAPVPSADVLPVEGGGQ